jgi:hypothetical protein
MPVYFMQPTDGGPVKIGFTDDLDARHKQLERHYGKPLTILATIEGGPDEERELHARFSHLRLGRTEQFRPAFDLMSFIGRPLLVGANPDAVEAMPGPPLDDETCLISIKCRREWREWAMSIARAERAPLATLVDQLLADRAKESGLPDPPARGKD